MSIEFNSGSSMPPGFIYSVFDTFAQRHVAVFYARTEQDAVRFVKLNFKSAPRETLDGLVLTLLQVFKQETELSEPMLSVLSVIPE